MVLYLSDRSFFVSTDGSSASEVLKPEHCVPQASVSSPVYLLCLYASHLSAVASIVHPLAAYYISSTQIILNNVHLTSALFLRHESIQSWKTAREIYSCDSIYNNNSLTLNADEAGSILSSALYNNFSSVSVFNVADVPVPLSSTINTLEVTRDAHLSFDSPTQAITKISYIAALDLLAAFVH